MLQKKVTCIVSGKEVTITEGNYFGTSHGMEGEGFQWFIRYLEETGLLSGVQHMAHDNDSSIGSMLALHTSLQHIKVCVESKQVLK